MPEGLVERMKEKTAAAGIDWDRFQYNDNSCSAQVCICLWLIWFWLPFAC